MRRLFRWEIRPTRYSADGKHVLALGVRIGYYPCLKAPFIQVTVWRWCLDVWHGYPSARQLADR